MSRIDIACMALYFMLVILLPVATVLCRGKLFSGVMLSWTFWILFFAVMSLVVPYFVVRAVGPHGYRPVMSPLARGPMLFIVFVCGWLPGMLVGLAAYGSRAVIQNCREPRDRRRNRLPGLEAPRREDADEPKWTTWFRMN